MPLSPSRAAWVGVPDPGEAAPPGSSPAPGDWVEVGGRRVLGDVRGPRDPGAAPRAPGVKTPSAAGWLPERCRRRRPASLTEVLATQLVDLPSASRTAKPFPTPCFSLP